jgi:peroxiredoxin
MATRDGRNLPRWIDDRLAALNPQAEWNPDETRGLAKFRERPSGPTGHRRGWMWLAVAVSTILLMFVPVPHLRGFAQACGEFVLRGLSGAGSSHTYKPALERTFLSDVELRDLGGGAVRLSDYRGKVVLVTYWTTTCGQCESEMAWFSEFQRTYSGQDFAVVGVSVDQGGAAAVSRYIAGRPIDYRVVLGDREVARVHAATSIPTTFILDRTGRIAVRHVGYCSKREFESDIQTVLAER